MRYAILMSLALLVGCSSVETRTYTVEVKNESTRPLTVWLTKNGGVYEEGWKAPEDLAVEFPTMTELTEPLAGLKVPMGKTAFTDSVTGKFRPGVDAILRIYVGDLKFAELLAVSRGASNRLEYTLHPGHNSFVVTDGPGGVKVETAQ